MTLSIKLISTVAGALLACAAMHPSNAQEIVMPNAYAARPAEYQVAGGAGGRLQQIYSSAEFGANSAFNIFAVAWRPGSALFAGTYTWTIPQFEVHAWTTTRDVGGLSTIFAENYADAADRTLVYSGPITFSTTLLGDGSLNPFDVIIPFQTPFHYDPAAGNLIIEIAGYTFYDNLWQAQVDLVAESDVVSYVWGSSARADGRIRGFGGAGLVTQFMTDFVPAPVVVTPSSLTLSPTTVAGGASSIASVTLSDAAPAGGLSVSISADSSAATVPSSILVPEGATSASFGVGTLPVTANTSVAIVAEANGATASGTLTVLAPVAPPTTLPNIKEFAVSPKTIEASAYEIKGEISLSGPAPAGGCAIQLTSSNPGALSVPASVKIAAGMKEAAFFLARGSVAKATTVQITATLGRSKKNVAVTVLP